MLTVNLYLQRFWGVEEGGSFHVMLTQYLFEGFGHVQHLTNSRLYSRICSGKSDGKNTGASHCTLWPKAAWSHHRVVARWGITQQAVSLLPLRSELRLIRVHDGHGRLNLVLQRLQGHPQLADELL